MKSSKGKHSKEKKPRVGSLRGALLAVFSLGFLFGFYKCYDIIHTNKTAREAYAQLSISTLSGAAAKEPNVPDSTDNPVKKEPLTAAANKTAKPPSTAAPDSGSRIPGKKRQRSMDFSSLREISPEITAWIKGTGTGIDYPVMFTDNNEYYLTHLYDGTYNVNGAIFIDCSNTDPFYDGNTVIYGHNMQSGAMFHSLNEYKSQDFYDAWPTMMLYTPEGDYLVELICGTIEDGDYGFVRYNFGTDEELIAYTEKLKERSTFKSDVELQPGDRLLSMCTCTYERNNARYMLVGKLTELYETASPFITEKTL